MIWRARDLTAERLKAWRAAAGWSQRELSLRSRVHVQTVKYWERQEGMIGGYAIGLFVAAFEAAGVARPSTVEVQNVAPPLCGANTKRGTKCQASPVPGNRRCKFHGGMSTGPRTEAGKEAIRASQLRRWAKVREMQSAHG